ncbi:MAG: glycosyltransferase family 39 protein [Candidatus Kaiserbacteria bacterium]|nr:glycosyltransferase family 39 protein [Candidatus Kaiserbacteria bacterium]
MNSKTRLILIGLLILFVAVRVPGLSTPYQQDEFKTAIAVETSLSAASTFLTHPPLTALLYRADALVFGGEHMRVMPLLFGLISAILLFCVARRRFNERTALWSVFLYTISFYGVWSSLMLDTDGTILPTLFLSAFYFYDRAKNENEKKRWILLLILALIAGLLVKLSFILVIGALIADFLFEKRKELTVLHVARIGMAGIAFAILAGMAFVGIKFLNPAFRMDGMISHAFYYVHWSGRSYLQIIIQSIKAVFYLSPLLLVPLVFISKDVLKKTAPFLWYLALGFIFYFVLFDFSHGALDKYLMFTIVPLCVISGAILSQLFTPFSLRDHSRYFIAGAILSAGLIALMFVSPEVVPLYPKTLWFSRVIHGNWNMLIAFNGGSGPVGFYVSFLVIVCSFLIAGVAALAGRIRKSLLGVATIVIVCTGIAYNAAFMEEFSFGKVNGSTTEALHSALSYIAAEGDIKSVITYNDIGAYELKHIGKYASHFTAAPQFENAARAMFPAHKGAFLVVNIPPLYDGFYRDFFNSCTILFTVQSGAITSTVYSSCTWTKG